MVVTAATCTGVYTNLWSSICTVQTRKILHKLSTFRNVNKQHCGSDVRQLKIIRDVRPLNVDAVVLSLNATVMSSRSLKTSAAVNRKKFKRKRLFWSKITLDNVNFTWKFFSHRMQPKVKFY